MLDHYFYKISSVKGLTTSLSDGHPLMLQLKIRQSSQQNDAKINI